MDVFHPKTSDKSVDVKLNVIPPTTRQLPSWQRENQYYWEEKKVTGTGEYCGVVKWMCLKGLTCFPLWNKKVQILDLFYLFERKWLLWLCKCNELGPKNMQKCYKSFILFQDFWSHIIVTVYETEIQWVLISSVFPLTKLSCFLVQNGAIY